MKTILAFFAVILAVQALTTEQRGKLLEPGLVCLKQTGIDREEIARLMSGDYSSTNPLLNDFCGCVMKSTGLLSDDGKYNKALSVQNSVAGGANERAVSEAIDTCLGKLGEVFSNNAFEYVKCYHEIQPEDIFI